MRPPRHWRSRTTSDQRSYWPRMLHGRLAELTGNQTTVGLSVADERVRTAEVRPSRSSNKHSSGFELSDSCLSKWPGLRGLRWRTIATESAN